MAESEIEILDNAINAAVVKPPGRKYPGIVIKVILYPYFITLLKNLKSFLKRRNQRKLRT
jgi:hypothetical protein